MCFNRRTGGSFQTLKVSTCLVTQQERRGKHLPESLDFWGAVAWCTLLLGVIILVYKDWAALPIDGPALENSCAMDLTKRRGR